MNFKNEYAKKMTTPFEAVGRIINGDRINVQASSQTSVILLNELYKRKDELKDIVVSSSLSVREHDIFKADCNGKIQYISSFLGAYERDAIKNGRNIDYYCFQLRNAEQVTRYRLDPTVLFVMACPMDEDGYLNLSISPGDMNLFTKGAREIIVQVNDQLPYVQGFQIHISEITALFEYSEAVATLDNKESDDTERKVASYIVDRISDGACLQIGIGGISNAVGYSLAGHRHLGIHTEMYTESMFYLTQKGAVDNSKKQLDRGISIAGFAMGSSKMYEFLDHNPTVMTKSVSYTNDPYIIAKQDNFVSVNSCISVDLTGQVCSESIGAKQFSGTGGQVDFVRGAQMSKGGMSFIAMKSTNTRKDGTISSKIVFNHPTGTVITTPRTDVQYIVSEYGVADLLNHSASGRAKELIKIAHPDFRDELKSQAKQAGLL
jgi:4-hydroxybutyrate CoA-transferase